MTDTQQPAQLEMTIEQATQFMLAFRACVTESRGDYKPLFAFLQQNASQLNQALLDALPEVFDRLIHIKPQGNPEKPQSFWRKLPRLFRPKPQTDNFTKSDAAWLFGWFGNVCSDFPLGSRRLNLELAIAAYEQALQVRTREAMPQDWAMTQGNLASALIARAEITDNPADLDQAIHLIESALEVAAVGSPHSINAQYRLGYARSRRYEISPDPDPTDLEQAIQAYKTALDQLHPEHYDWQDYWQALPNTQTILGRRLVRDGQWQQGLQLLLNSISQLRHSPRQLDHANALYQTAKAHEILTDWDKARLYYRDALRLYQHLDHAPGIAKSHSGLGAVLIAQGYLEKGITHLTTARARYQELGQPEAAAEADTLYQAAQTALAKLEVTA